MFAEQRRRSLSHTTWESTCCVFPTAGAGAAAAANDAAGYFKYELLRRIAMEFVMPWVSLLLVTRRKAANKCQRQQQPQNPQAQPMQASSAVAQPVGTIGTTTVSAAEDRRGGTVGGYVTAAFSDADKGKHHGSMQKRSGAADVDSNVLRPQFDPFTGIWDVTRDMG